MFRFFLVLRLVFAVSVEYIDKASICLRCQDGNPLNQHLYCEKFDREAFAERTEGLSDEKKDGLLLYQ